MDFPLKCESKDIKNIGEPRRPENEKLGSIDTYENASIETSTYNKANI
jgi:hypothetical protein